MSDQHAVEALIAQRRSMPLVPWLEKLGSSFHLFEERGGQNGVLADSLKDALRDALYGTEVEWERTAVCGAICLLWNSAIKSSSSARPHNQALRAMLATELFFGWLRVRLDSVANDIMLDLPDLLRDAPSARAIVRSLMEEKDCREAVSYRPRRVIRGLLHMAQAVPHPHLNGDVCGMLEPILIHAMPPDPS